MARLLFSGAQAEIGALPLEAVAVVPSTTQFLLWHRRRRGNPPLTEGTDALLLEDNTSILLLEDNTSQLLLG
jgi:hypothetical protein